ncbi:hypothetical protein RHGRI_017187 [Rhododendron griersonianum]|uniref:Uncharacterized protein n=1 Tax=Rhododendron griersonianum TaxID=479676 RepID=A0AAV6JWY5_9ERIC|nr:hypothetical protein RHGRI_017187 [Rhododendron griersonianum]
MQEAAESAKRPFLEQQNQEEDLSKNKKQKIKKQKISELSELPKSLQRLDAPSILKVWPTVGWLKPSKIIPTCFLSVPIIPGSSSTCMRSVAGTELPQGFLVSLFRPLNLSGAVFGNYV